MVACQADVKADMAKLQEAKLETEMAGVKGDMADVKELLEKLLAQSL